MEFKSSYLKWVVLGLQGFVMSGVQAAESRWQGELSFNVGYISVKDNLSTKTDQSIANYAAPNDHDGIDFAGGLGQISYRLDDDNRHRLYFGTSRADIAIGTLALELGYQWQQDWALVDISFLPTVLSQEAWQNPYLLNQNRQETDQKGHAFRLQLKNIGDSRLSLELGYGDTEIEDEGIMQPSLHRSGDAWLVRGQYMQPLSRSNGLISALAWLNYDAQGQAASYQRYELRMTYFHHINQHQFALTGAYGFQDYDAVHPIFLKTREQQDGRLFLAYEYQNLWGVDALSANLLLGYQLGNANLDFYDNEQIFTSIGLGWQF
ncbi:hypothetical protein VST7929_01126 [Vibrio stylophorae]|uniref:DUF2860 domain-containing protein n=1 Tax=Vibrio stylophorae TaxID=659351 RepID=A0ABN8DV79_9VIBR|nr:DUF2860 family protein [Vibrio stylophorae]CAH0533262.1 hypothetical protein VST7929_01126 [Vibrio stylophorae]